MNVTRKFIKTYVENTSKVNKLLQYMNDYMTKTYCLKLTENAEYETMKSIVIQNH